MEAYGLEMKADLSIARSNIENTLEYTLFKRSGGQWEKQHSGPGQNNGEVDVFQKGDRVEFINVFFYIEGDFGESALNYVAKISFGGRDSPMRQGGSEYIKTKNLPLYPGSPTPDGLEYKKAQGSCSLLLLEDPLPWTFVFPRENPYELSTEIGMLVFLKGKPAHTLKFKFDPQWKVNAGGSGPILPSQT